MFDILAQLEPSGRGEFEITDALNSFIARRSFVSYEFDGEWQDAGTVESLLAASGFAAGFAAEVPNRSSVGPEAVEAERVPDSSGRRSCVASSPVIRMSKWSCSTS